ncbi:polysaccharide pyruvyl transferase family protein [Synechococcus sp. Cruz-9H2]|uniref:polysaccharide pyruvyl transferase family protein n=1 Tax=unclassified Synechococcus TaxID=2626047 RepID=UPI0020CBB756|nr:MULTISPECIES: polysaccharide pyruvyl transferase family protein [unclassified Synechococcus]MCP9818149.1 polysaccharide pyruvyl transferase family protein [Synechococcus sp. Cruz-9H2]MCP9842351.1 polysaccharide pyruvyl transferase family protein [Synechococcus sp. Edmonson 11F2]MCP9854545.1 polysaccharide pyruvyl transferase family protein [Synechococcus sp. Cruz-9C9]MCP9861759.1 polysaccharide pyruvyl transferase family protein [Synechococcus sp. Cruz-7E5]MCP9869057.1 polysaccharide pyruvy
MPKRLAVVDNLAGISSFKDIEAWECSTARYSSAVGGNTGNVAFVLGAKLAIADRQQVIGWGMNPTEAQKQFDHVVICCANQIGAHVDLGGWAKILNAWSLPVTLIGLGAQTTNYEDSIDVPSGTKTFLSTVKSLRASTSPNIGVRGHYTQQVLESIGYDSVVTGCPSLFISSDQRLGNTIASYDIEAESHRIVAAAGNPYHVASRKLEERLVALVDDTRGAYIVQHPDVMLSLASGIIKEELNPKVESILGAYGGRFNLVSIRHWMRKNAYSFYDAISWIDFLQHYDFVLGPRYHGVALGVQAGRPSLCIHIDNRTRELASTTGIKSIGINEFMEMGVEDILASVKWSMAEANHFDHNRTSLAKILHEFLTSNDLQPADRLTALASTFSILKESEQTQFV